MSFRNLKKNGSVYLLLMKYIIKESRLEQIILSYLNSKEWSKPWLDSMGILLISEKGDPPAWWKFGIREKDGKIVVSRSFMGFLTSMFGEEFNQRIIHQWAEHKFSKYIK